MVLLVQNYEADKFDYILICGSLWTLQTITSSTYSHMSCHQVPQPIHQDKYNGRNQYHSHMHIDNHECQLGIHPHL